jgi:hypothetical protein
MQYLKDATNLTKSQMVNFTASPYSTFVKNTPIFNINAVNITNGIVVAISRKLLLLLELKLVRP